MRTLSRLAPALLALALSACAKDFPVRVDPCALPQADADWSVSAPDAAGFDAETLCRLSGKPLAELAREDLFAPLGIARFEWTEDMHGRALSFAGLRLRPRDMLKVGRLVNARGMWRGRQVVPADWIAESLRPRLSTGIRFRGLGDKPAAYGYQWWLGQVSWGGRELDWALALGNGGQRIFLVPELELSVVLTAGDYDEIPIQLAENRILRALVSAVTR